MKATKTVLSPANLQSVFPAQAGIHTERPITRSMDPRMREDDGSEDGGFDEEQVAGWLAQIPDPEIPAISIIDLGIVRAVRVADDGACHITITPTYSGCPAMQVIGAAITDALHAHSVMDVVLHTQLTPAWTTDWMTDTGKEKLRNYGIAPPAEQAQVIDISRLRGGAAVVTAVTAAAAVSRRGMHAVPKPAIACPHCGSTHTEVTSQFGSTPCKALYKCLDCREPFDYFKCH